jgi:hypothetical protein
VDDVMFDDTRPRRSRMLDDNFLKRHGLGSNPSAAGPALFGHGSSKRLADDFVEEKLTVTEVTADEPSSLVAPVHLYPQTPRQSYQRMETMNRQQTNARSSYQRQDGEVKQVGKPRKHSTYKGQGGRRHGGAEGRVTDYRGSENMLMLSRVVYS